MKSLPFFSVLFFFCVSVLSVDFDKPVTKTICKQIAVIHYSKTNNSSIMPEGAQYEMALKSTGLKDYNPELSRTFCKLFGGVCRNQCHEKEFRLIGCERPETPCCMHKCATEE